MIPKQTVLGAKVVGVILLIFAGAVFMVWLDAFAF